MAQYKVSEANLLQLQYNLIRSHSSGGGKMMPLMVKAVMVAFKQPDAGLFRVHSDTVKLLVTLINNE
jgi:histidine ammonia-lyase